MESLRATYKILLRERKSTIRRELMDKIDPSCRLIAIKGTRGVGKTNFLLDFSREHYADNENALYVNVNNLFLSDEGLFNFLERFYHLGGKAIFLDQVHKFPGWDADLRRAYDTFQDLYIVFTTSSIVRIKCNEHLKDVVAMYNLRGLSFREFLELETGEKFSTYTFEDIVERHQEIATEITSKVRPLAHFSNYLRYGFYPIYLAEKSHIDYLLKNINLTLEFDIPYSNQIDLTYLPKLKRLLYRLGVAENTNVNISKLSSEIGVSRATILNYLRYMNDARLITLLYNEENTDEGNRKPDRVFIHNANLLNAVCLDQLDDHRMRQVFFISQINPKHSIHVGTKCDLQIDNKFQVNICKGCLQKCTKKVLCLEDMIERGEGNTIPLWLFGFIY
ncbi:MAG: AAA family ATPase [Marinifilaceae bacterium]